MLRWASREVVQAWAHRSYLSWSGSPDARPVNSCQGGVHRRIASRALRQKTLSSISYVLVRCQDFEFFRATSGREPKGVSYHFRSTETRRVAGKLVEEVP